MIKLVKLQMPEKEAIKARRYTGEVREYIRRKESVPKKVLNKYRNFKIKDLLNDETHGKCAYCETRFIDLGSADIEHLVPKSEEPLLAFEWSNLTLSCKQCNVNKSSLWDPKLQFINPYTDKIWKHLRFLGSMIDNANNSPRGEVTIDIMDLNRKGLMLARWGILDKIKSAFRLWHKSEGLKKMGAAKSLRAFVREDEEFTFMIRTYLREKGFKA